VRVVATKPLSKEPTVESKTTPSTKPARGESTGNETGL